VERTDSVHTTALRSEPTREQRAFVPWQIRNNDVAEVLFLEGEWAYVRTRDEGEGYMQRRHFQNP
jgi:hypothetical protein